MRLSPLLCSAVLAIAGCAVSAGAPAPVGPLVVRGPGESGGPAFLGSSACRGCHEEAYVQWRATGHARGFAGLPPADRQDTACLRCHATGYGERLGYRSAGETPALASVGCEACHGPGSDHGRSDHPEFVPTLTGGECPPCEINRVCRRCHTPERSAGFDLARALARVTCKR